jgi:hypothetical protein
MAARPEILWIAPANQKVKAACCAPIKKSGTITFEQNLDLKYGAK